MWRWAHCRRLVARDRRDRDRDGHQRNQRDRCDEFDGNCGRRRGQRRRGFARWHGFDYGGHSAGRRARAFHLRAAGCRCPRTARLCLATTAADQRLSGKRKAPTSSSRECFRASHRPALTSTNEANAGEAGKPCWLASRMRKSAIAADGLGGCHPRGLPLRSTRWLSVETRSTTRTRRQRKRRRESSHRSRWHSTWYVPTRVTPFLRMSLTKSTWSFAGHAILDGNVGELGPHVERARSGGETHRGAMAANVAEGAAHHGSEHECKMTGDGNQ